MMMNQVTLYKLMGRGLGGKSVCPRVLVACAAPTEMGIGSQGYKLQCVRFPSTDVPTYYLSGVVVN